MHKLAIFASGAGSNARKIIEYFKGNPEIRVDLVVSNKSNAGVLNIAEEFNIPVLIIDKEQFFRGNNYIDELQEAGITFIVLAGFLWKVPVQLVQAYKGRMVNIHPALLPKYGGKGMYGSFVHEAVIAAGESESGITIHFVDELFDHGHHIFQATCPVEKSDTPETLAARVHQLEHQYYPEVLEKVLKENPPDNK